MAYYRKVEHSEFQRAVQHIHWALNLVDQADDAQDTETAEGRGGEQTALVPHLERVLAFLQAQMVLRHALHVLEEAHHDVGCDREAQIVGLQQMDFGY